MSLAAISDHIDAPKSGVYRTLQSLIADGYVSQDADSSDYRLTLALPALGLQFLSRNSLTSVALPLLDSLATSTGQLVRLALADTDRLVWVAKRQGSRSGLRFDPDHAAEVPLASTATGLAWLAHFADDEAVAIAVRNNVPLRHPAGKNLPIGVSDLIEKLNVVRARGWASVEDSYESGISAIAAAIGGAEGERAIGVVSVAGPSIHLPPKRLSELAPELLGVVAQLGRIPSSMLPTPRPSIDLAVGSIE